MDPVKITILGLPGIAAVLAADPCGLWCVRLPGLATHRSCCGRDGMRTASTSLAGASTRHQARPAAAAHLQRAEHRPAAFPHLLGLLSFTRPALTGAWCAGCSRSCRFRTWTKSRSVGWFLEIFSVLVLISLGVAVARRLFFAPKYLHLSLDANLILGLIGLLMLSTGAALASPTSSSSGAS